VRTSSGTATAAPAKVALGLKAHSGWAALVVLRTGEGRLAGDRVDLVDRRRIELVLQDEAGWAKQPYHTAEELQPADARRMVERGIESARRHAEREMRAAIERLAADGHTITGCAVLMGAPMPAWSVDEILAVHVRMHKAEGMLFREALAGAVTSCGLRLVAIPEKELNAHAARALSTSVGVLQKRVAAIGRSAGPPWGKDQKEAALGAMVALLGRRSRGGTR
jgi:hypothetical protein